MRIYFKLLSMFKMTCYESEETAATSVAKLKKQNKKQVLGGPPQSSPKKLIS